MEEKAKPCLKRWALAASVILLLSSNGVSGGDKPVESRVASEVAKVNCSIGNRGGNLVYSLVGEPASFNYLAARDQRSHIVNSLTTATLLEYDQVAQRVVPGLVKKWDRAKDGLSYTLRLREKLKFSDGHPFTADDVLFTFEAIFHPQGKFPLADNLTFNGKRVKAERIDQHTVKLTFPQKYAAAEYILTTVPVLPKHILESALREHKISEAWNLATDPSKVVGLGPFKLYAHKAGQQTILVSNPYYWKVDSQGNPLPYLDKITIIYTGNKNTQALKFQASEIDILDPLRPEDLKTLRNGGSHKRSIIADLGPSLNLVFLWFNLNEGINPNTKKGYIDSAKLSWFQNELFRKAISSAIDRESINMMVFLGQASTVWSFITPGDKTWHYPNVAQFPYNPTKALEYLKQGGFTLRVTGGRKVLYDANQRPVEFTLLTNSGNNIREKIGAMIQSDLASIGIKVNLVTMEFRAVISKLTQSFDYDAVLFGWDSVLEPADLMNVYRSNGAMHVWYPSQTQPATKWEKEIDQLMDKQLTMLDPSERKKIIADVQSIMAEHVPVIFVASPKLLVAANEKLGNFKPSISFPYSLWNAWEIYLKH